LFSSKEKVFGKAKWRELSSSLPNGETLSNGDLTMNHGEQGNLSENCCDWVSQSKVVWKWEAEAKILDIVPRTGGSEEQAMFWIDFFTICKMQGTAETVEKNMRCFE
jgi:hypothetical protein